MFSDFEGIQRRLAESGDEARLMNDPGVEPEAGGVYSVSPSFRNGDQSYTSNFCEVMGISGPNALVKVHGGFSDKPILMQIGERYWYEANDLFAIYKATISKQDEE